MFCPGCYYCYAVWGWSEEVEKKARACWVLLQLLPRNELFSLRGPSQAPGGGGERERKTCLKIWPELMRMERSYGGRI